MKIGTIGKEELNINFWKLSILYIGVTVVATIVFILGYIGLLLFLLLLGW